MGVRQRGYRGVIGRAHRKERTTGGVQGVERSALRENLPHGGGASTRVASGHSVGGHGGTEHARTEKKRGVPLGRYPQDGQGCTSK